MFTGLQQGAGASQVAQGATIYIFDQKGLDVLTAAVTNVSSPHISKAAQGNPMAAYQGLVVDLTLSTGSDTTTVEFPVNSVTATYPDRGWVVSTDRAVVSREVEAIGNSAKQRIANHAADEKISARCDQILLRLNPEKQQAALHEQEMAQIRTQMAQMASQLGQLVTLFSAANPKNDKKTE